MLKIKYQNKVLDTKFCISLKCTWDKFSIPKRVLLKVTWLCKEYGMETDSVNTLQVKMECFFIFFVILENQPNDLAFLVTLWFTEVEMKLVFYN